MPDRKKFITIRGARQHNLKALDVRIPRGLLTVVTGPSGSGKSSLAFDTLYAEGQRRYVESFSAYARQFLERMDRPDVDSVDGVLPAVAIERKNSIRSSRSTVGTLTELADYFKLLFARGATLHCEDCGVPVQRDTAGSAADALIRDQAGQSITVTFPIVPNDVGGIEVADAWLRGRGWFRIADEEGTIRRLDRDGETIQGTGSEVLYVVQDRVVAQPDKRARLVEALEHALREGRGHARAFAPTGTRRFTSHLRCTDCARSYSLPSPALFSFNTPLGACEACNGFGRVIDVDIDRIIPDPALSLADGAIKPWTTPKTDWERERMAAWCALVGIDLDAPWASLSASDQSRVFDGEEATGWHGVRGWFRGLERKAYRMHIRVFLSRYRAYTACQGCHGARYSAATLLWRVGDLNLEDVGNQALEQAQAWHSALDLSTLQDQALDVVRREIGSRLGYLVDIGLGYLTLNRASRTLSGGELQRVNLTTALGSRLVDTLYVLDEPSVGLHPRDNHRLLGVLRGIRDLGNTVVVVEHDEAIIRAADHLIDLGPASGDAGGAIQYEGPPAGVTTADSATAIALRNPEIVPADRRAQGPWLTIYGARGNNLQSIDAAFALNALTCVSGVSGSGKSTLVIESLYRGLKRKRGETTEAPAPFDRIAGDEVFQRIVLVDAVPAAKSPRSNAATYLKAWDPIRKLFASEPASAQRGFSPATFSFNTAGGRCDVCEGSGFERVEMQFLSDLFLTCDACHGRRFERDVLEVKHRGHNVAEVLGLTVDRAREVFAGSRPVMRCLEPLARVGLGYLRLGQPLSTLSGGESQRLQIADGLRKGARKGPALFIMDEPTSGLHLTDVDVLLRNLRALVEQGHTVIVIEHHLNVIAAADHVIDLGPEGGAAGGLLLVAGSPAQVAQHATSHTGHWLRAPTAGATPVPPLVDERPSITIKGARVNNLQDVSVVIPRGQMTVVTGPSGSGKSSLAFDVLFAEGQRRFIDCLSPYARQYIVQQARPDLDELEGCPPTVAVEQRTTRTGQRSTVATVTELYHFLRLLFAKAGTQHCHICGDPVQGLTNKELTSTITEQHQDKRIMLLAPVIKGRKGWHKDVLRRAVKLGLAMVRVDGSHRRPAEDLELARYQEHDIEYVILPDHVVRRRSGGAALEAAVGQALEEGHGTCFIEELTSGDTHVYSVDLYCNHCRVGFEPPEPRLFSFHGRKSGACRVCEGVGLVGEEEEKALCDTCDGTRLTAVARAVRIAGRSIDQVCALTPPELLTWLESLSFDAPFSLDARRQAIARPIVDELMQRCRFLLQVGLDYLSLSRSGDTLSGGEAQRVRLAAQLASQLHGVLYVLDEPTIGLHPADNERLLAALDTLRERGNTIVVVEHDTETIERADLVIDMGPGGGRNGGAVTSIGTPAQLRLDPSSLTGRWLSAPPAQPAADRPPPESFIELTGVTRHNLRGVDVAIPRGRLTTVTGVSGSGKSTLIRHVLQQELQQRGERVIEVDQRPIGRTPRSTPATYVKIMDRIRTLFASLPAAQIRGYRPGRFSFNVKGGRCETCAGQGALNIEMAFLPNVYVPCDVCEGRRYNPETLAMTWRGKNIAEVLASTVDEIIPLFEAHRAINGALQLMSDLGLGYLTLGQSSATLSGGEAQRIKLVAELSRRSRERTVYLLDEPSTGLHMSDLARLITVLQRLVERGDTVVVIEHNLDLIRSADWIVDLGPGGGTHGGRIVFQGPVDELVATTDSKSVTGQWLRR